MTDSQIGVIGLGVMGGNLARNFASHGFKVAVYNRTTEKMTSLIEAHGDEGLIGHETLEAFIQGLETPRRVVLMVNAGKAVDAVLAQLTPLLEKDDVIIDCGNSNFKETIRREVEMNQFGLHFVGCGVSGGEVGALEGPSMMPGGSEHAWEQIKPFFEPAAAKDFNGGPCVTYIGTDGAGHYVKMVHNGIEYAVMQMMAEGYDILRKVFGLSAPEIADAFETYQAGRLQSYLFEIAIEVLRKDDEFSEGSLVDNILDQAGQKGTGRWTVIDGFERGVAISSISESVMGRVISSQKNLRKKLSKSYKHSTTPSDVSSFLPQLEQAFYNGIVMAYAQGYDLMKTASDEHEWNLNLSEISRIWEGGCIIRATLLNTLHEAYASQKGSLHLLEIESMKKPIQDSMNGFRSVLSLAILNGVPTPSLSASLAYFDNLTQSEGSANFIQGLRDYFGAHTYQCTDREGTFHTDWN